MGRILIRTLLIALASLAVVAQADAQAWPNRPITVIVPFAAGGNVDAVARLIAPELARRVGQSVVVENAAGAGGVIGTQRAIRAEPDGHTLLLSVESSIVLAKLVAPATVPYDALDELTPLTLIGTQPLVLVGRPDLPATSLDELLRLAKAEPGRFSYGTSGVGTSLHLAGELINQKAGVGMVHVPYRAGAQIPVDLMGGNLDLAVLSITSVAPLVTAGKLRAFGVTERRRSPLLPEVAPLAEHPALHEVEVTVWQGLFAPTGTDPSITTRLQAAMGAVIEAPGIRQRLGDLGIRPAGSGGADFAAFLRAENEKWAPVVAAGRISAE